MLGASGKEYKLSIVIEGHDKASGPLGGASGALGRIGEIAAGIVGSQVFMKMAEGILSSAKAALSATADYQMMEVGIQALMAREISRGQTTEQLVQQSASLSTQEQLRLIELTRLYDDQTVKLKELQTQYAEVSTAQGAGSEQALRLKLDLDKMTSSVSSAKNEIAGLKDQSDGATMALQKITTGTMSVSDAMPQARIEAEKLLKQIRLLAIQSPFELATVQQTFKMGMAFGFTADQSMAFTRGLLNSAAGIGATSEMLDRMAYNLAQVRMQGKVTAMDVRQLAMAGFDLNGVLVDMAAKYGYTITNHLEFNKLIDEGKLKWADFATSFEEYSDKNFGGASKRLSQTWNGMMSNFKDVFALSMPSIMGPALEKVTGFLNGLMAKFIEFTNSGKLEEWGAKFGESVGKVVDFAQGLVDGMAPTIAFLKDFNERFGKFIAMLTTNIELGAGPGKSLSLAFENAFGVKIPDFITTDLSTIDQFIRDIRQSALDAKPAFDNMIANFAQFWKDNGAGIQETVGKIFADLNTDRSEFLVKITAILSDLADRVMPFLTAQWEKISAWFVANGPLIQGFLESMRPLINAITETLKAVLDVIGELLKLVWNILQPLLSGIVDLFLNVAKLVMQVFTGDFKGAFDTLVAILIGVRDTIWNVLLAAWGTILGWFGTSFADLQTKWTTWWTNLELKVVEIWTNIKTAIVEKYEAIKADIGVWLESMKLKVTNFIPNLVVAGRDLIQGLWDGLKDRFNQLMEWFTGAIQEITDKAKKILGIASPSAVFAGIGQNIMQGLEKGITGNVNVPVSAIAGASQDVTQAMTNGYGNSGSTTSNSNQVTFYISGADDPDKVVDNVMQRLRLQGLLTS